RRRAPAAWLPQALEPQRRHRRLGAGNRPLPAPLLIKSKAQSVQIGVAIVGAGLVPALFVYSNVGGTRTGQAQDLPLRSLLYLKSERLPKVQSHHLRPSSGLWPLEC